MKLASDPASPFVNETLAHAVRQSAPLVSGRLDAWFAALPFSFCEE